MRFFILFAIFAFVAAIAATPANSEDEQELSKAVAVIETDLAACEIISCFNSCKNKYGDRLTAAYCIGGDCWCEYRL